MRVLARTAAVAQRARERRGGRRLRLRLPHSVFGKCWHLTHSNNLRFPIPFLVARQTLVLHWQGNPVLRSHVRMLLVLGTLFKKSVVPVPSVNQIQNRIQRMSLRVGQHLEPPSLQVSGGIRRPSKSKSIGPNYLAKKKKATAILFRVHHRSSNPRRTQIEILRA